MKGDIKPFEMMARREDWSDGVSIFARQVTEGMGMVVAQPLTMKDHDSPNACAEPFLRLTIHEAQILIDELWQCGLRPSEGTGSAGSLAATEKHLSDMRKIAFKKLSIA